MSSLARSLLARVPLLSVQAALALTLGLLVPFFFLAWPARDDFARAAVMRDLSIEEAGACEWLGWTGRWSGVGLSFLTSALIDLETSYALPLLVIAAVFVLAMHALLRAAFRDALSRASAARLALAFAALYWLGMPAPGETWYWLTGGIENFLNVACGVLLVSALIALPRAGDGRERRVDLSLLLGAFAAFTIGMHELFGTLLLAVLATGTAVAFATGRGDRAVWSAVTLLAALGVLVVVGAPGNEIRASGMQHGRDLANTLASADEEALLVAGWTLDPRLWAASLLLLLVPGMRRAPAWFTDHRALWCWLFPLASAAVLAFACFVPVWATGFPMPERTRDGTYLLFLLGWFATALAWAWRFPRLWPTRPSGVALLRGSAAAVFLLCLGLVPLATGTDAAGASRVLHSNLTHAFVDIAERLPPFQAAMRAQTARLHAAAHDGTELLELPSLPPRPALLTSTEADADPSEPMSYALALYYGIGAVRGVAAR